MIMISFGGVVGASIWYGTGFTIAYSGPVGALICFLIMGINVFFVMQCVGEMSTLFPVQGGFLELAARFGDPSLAFSLGYNYWYLWVCNVAGDLNTSSVRVLSFFLAQSALTLGSSSCRTGPLQCRHTAGSSSGARSTR